MTETQTQEKPEEKKEQSDSERVKEIRFNIQSGESWLRNGNYGADRRKDMWRRNKAYMRCDWKEAERNLPEHEKSTFHVNIPFANFHTIRPNLIYKNPTIGVVSRKPEFVRDSYGQEMKDETGAPQIKSDNYLNSRLMQVRINHEIQQIRLKDIVKRCVGHADGHYGIGWAKVGYQRKTVSEFNNDRDQKINYWIEWCDPRDIVFDWKAVEGKKLRWIAQRFALPRSDLEADGFTIPKDYSGQLPEHLKDKETNAEYGQSSPMGSCGPENDLIVFWEYHDLVHNTIDWICDSGSTSAWAIMKETSTDSYPFEGSSFEPLVLTEDDDDLIGITNIQPVEDQFKALNRMREREVYHMDNFGTGIIAEEGSITRDELKKYIKTPFGFVVFTKQGQLNKVQTVTTPAMGQDHYSMSNVHKEEIQTTIGITDYQKGAGGGVTATEAQIITSSANIRVDSKRDTIADFVINLVRKLAAMIQEYDTEVQFYNVANEEFDDDFIDVLKKQYGYNPKLPFLGISRDRIKGEFDFSFKIEDMINQPKEVQAAQLARSLQAVASNELLLKKFVEDYDFGKLIVEMFELNGVDIKKFNKGGPVQISAVIEDQMFKAGMEVPEPHPKDDDDEHNASHGRFVRELEGMLAQIQQKAAQIQSGVQQKMAQLQSGLQMAPQMMMNDPAKLQQVQQKAQMEIQTLQMQLQEQMNQVEMEMEPLNQQLRRVKLHMQAHVKQSARKANEDLSASAGPGGQPMGPQTGRPAQGPNQVQMNQPAQVPQM